MKDFGITADGQPVTAVTLAAGDLSVTLLTWGAVVQDVRLAGVPYSLTQGSDNISDYQGEMRFHGSLIGPVVNRITGGFAVIDGVRHAFEQNLRGLHLIHCGAAGTHQKHWTLVGHGPDHATLTITLPDGEGGFPGNRQVSARFEVAPPATLRLTVTGTTDAATLMNFANHSYWILDGTPGWSGHHLRVAAARMLPSDDDFKPTGEVFAVAGTPFDFQSGRVIAVGDPLLDNCFCLSDSRQPLREVLWLTGQSGVTMTIATTETGIHLYDGRDAIRPGHAPHEGLAFEPESWPDATTHAGFPSVTLRIPPGDTVVGAQYRQPACKVSLDSQTLSACCGYPPARTRAGPGPEHSGQLDARYDQLGTTRFVDPVDLSHDMHVNIVTFLPGGRIPFAETHVMEHGLYVLEGTAHYLLNRDWVTVGPGDFIWLRAFCPQACIATGTGPFRYLLYKDMHRHPSLTLP